MTEKLQQIYIRIPSTILENGELTKLQILILSVNYTFHKKLGFNALSNLGLSEMIGVDTNTLGKHRKDLVKMGYERIDDHKYYLTDKVQKKRKQGVKEILLVPQVYSIKGLSIGAKLLWAEYNSLEKGDIGHCNAGRDYLAKRLNSSEDSITNWFNKLKKLGLLSYTELKHGKNTKQRIVKTRKFKRGEIFIVNEVVKEDDLKEENEGQTEVLQSTEMKEIKVPLGSFEFSDDFLNWRTYMADVDNIDLENNTKLNEFVFEIDSKINDREDNRVEVFQSLLNQIDDKMKKRVGIEELKLEMKDYLTVE